MRKAAAWLGIVIASALAGCGRSDTGVDVHVHLGALAYDELQFRATVAGGDVVVDPMTNGRYQGPFQAGDQDVLIYLRDDLDGSQLHCEASALRAGAVAGAGDVTVARGEMKDVEIFMADGGSSVPPGRSNGEACSVDAECLTGHCADGVCCESDCKMGCHSCALADSMGLCRPIAAGAPDPRGVCHDQGSTSCKQTGLCAVDGTCAVYPAGTICGQTGCDPGGKMAILGGACDGAGMCSSPAKIKCSEGTTCVAGVCTEVQTLPP
jgi:hypothetical protein